MSFRDRFLHFRDFIMHDVWNLPGSERGSMSVWARIIRVGHLLFRGYVDDDLMIHASSLTFVTLTSLVPILAVGFALMRGLGVGGEQLARLSELEWMEQMPDQFQLFVGQILDIVNNTNFAALGWIGLAFFVLTAVLVLANVEKSFNRVWGVDTNRSLIRQIANYTSVLVLVPLLLGVAGGLRAQIVINQQFFKVDVNAWVQNLISFGIVWLAIAFLYVFVPNTRVRVRPAVVSSLVTTLIFLGWMRVFAVMQTGVARYNMIYGAFAAVPVFMFWMYVTWVILLLGAELTFALQNSDTFQMESAAETASMRTRLLVALMILRRTGHVMEKHHGPFDASVFARKNRAPIRLINAVVSLLVRLGYLAPVATRDAGYVLMRSPENIRLSDLVAELLREGGRQSEASLGIRLDPALDATMAKMDNALSAGLADRTLADLVAELSDEESAP